MKKLIILFCSLLVIMGCRTITPSENDDLIRQVNQDKEPKIIEPPRN